MKVLPRIPLHTWMRATIHTRMPIRDSNEIFVRFSVPNIAETFLALAEFKKTNKNPLFEVVSRGGLRAL